MKVSKNLFAIALAVASVEAHYSETDKALKHPTSDIHPTATTNSYDWDGTDGSTPEVSSSWLKDDSPAESFHKTTSVSSDAWYTEGSTADSVEETTSFSYKDVTSFDDTNSASFDGWDSEGSIADSVEQATSSYGDVTSSSYDDLTATSGYWTSSKSGEEGTIENGSTDYSTEQSSSESFTEEQKAIWIERHNFFRVAGLPWAAGNMRRIDWEEELAQEAAQTAATCTANTTTGINVYQSTSSEPSKVLEEAIKAWIIEPSLSTIGSVTPPAKDGDEIGAGLYNSYSQVVWASTTGVGCAMAPCSGGSTVVCQYSPAGNDGQSPWYIHAAQATECPTGTTAYAGLCVEEGKEKNDLIALVPNGQKSLQVYPTFIPNIMSAILEATQARDGTGVASKTAISSDGMDISDDKSEESFTQSSNSYENYDFATESSNYDSSSSTFDDNWDVTPSDDSKPKGNSYSFGDFPSTQGSSSTESFPSDLLNDASNGPADWESSLYSDVSETTKPGTVKPESSYFKDSNWAPSSTPSLKQQEQETPKQDASMSKDVVPTTTRSELAAHTSAAVSPFGIAAIIVLGIVAIAGFAVFVSHRKKQQQQMQLKLMRDDGIIVI